jgi:heptosyltransferase-2
MRDAPSRIVVIAPNWLGDIAMALPSVADIRRQFSRAILAVAARGPLAPLYESVPGIDQIVPLGATSSVIRRWRSDANALKPGRFDAAILFPNSFYSAWIAARAGIPERWGYRTDLRGTLLTRAVPRPRGTIHRAAYYQNLVRELGSSSGPLRPHIDVPERYRISASKLLAAEGWTPSVTLVGLAPGAAYGSAKQWPPRHVATLARMLVERGIWCLLVGAAADRDAGRQVAAAFERSPGAGPPSGQLLNLIGRTDVRQLLGLMTFCDSFVGNDSGATYLAAAIGLPVVAIYGPTDVRVASPLPGRDFTGTHRALSHPVFCSPCWLRECPIDHRCMVRLEPSTVLDGVIQQLLPRGAPSVQESVERGIGNVWPSLPT